MGADFFVGKINLWFDIVGELISIESETMYEAASTESESEPEMDFDLFDSKCKSMNVNIM